jgi:hypothetical protein
MEEGDPVPTGAGPGLPVDEFHPGPGETLELGREIGHPVCDVMEAGAPSLEEAGDRSRRIGGLQEFGATHEGNPDPLTLHFFRGGTSLPGQEFVDWSALSNGVYRDRNMVDGMG